MRRSALSVGGIAQLPVIRLLALRKKCLVGPCEFVGVLGFSRWGSVVSLNRTLVAAKKQNFLVFFDPFDHLRADRVMRDHSPSALSLRGFSCSLVVISMSDRVIVYVLGLAMIVGLPVRLLILG